MDPDADAPDLARLKRYFTESEQLTFAARSNSLRAIDYYFRVMVNQQQPEMAKELGLTYGNPGAAGKLISFAQHARPPAPPAPPAPLDPYHGLDLDRFGKDAGNYLRRVGKTWGPERAKLILKAWNDINETANDNSLPPNWAGRVPPNKPIDYPTAPDFEPPKPLRDTMTEEEKIAWMKTAANDNADWTSEEYREPYQPRVWGAPRAQLPAVWQPPRVQLPAVWQPPRAQVPALLRRSAEQAGTNAFSGWTIVPPAPREVNRIDFNALKPPRWFGPAMVGAANQPRDLFPQIPPWVGPTMSWAASQQDPLPQIEGR
jgi:hypothetical protein